MFHFFRSMKKKPEISDSEITEQIEKSNRGMISFGEVTREFFIVPIKEFLRERAKGNLCICVCNYQIWVIANYKDSKQHRKYFNKCFQETGVYISKLYYDGSGELKESNYEALCSITDVKFM